MMSGESELLGHERDERRLGNGLGVTDGQGVVFIRMAALRGGQKCLTLHGAHRAPDLRMMIHRGHG